MTCVTRVLIYLRSARSIRSPNTIGRSNQPCIPSFSHTETFRTGRGGLASVDVGARSVLNGRSCSALILAATVLPLLAFPFLRGHSINDGEMLEAHTFLFIPAFGVNQ